MSVVLLLILGNGVLDWSFCTSVGRDVIQWAERFSGEKQRQQTLPRLWGSWKGHWGSTAQCCPLELRAGSWEKLCRKLGKERRGETERELWVEERSGWGQGGKGLELEFLLRKLRKSQGAPEGADSEEEGRDELETAALDKDWSGCSCWGWGWERETRCPGVGWAVSTEAEIQGKSVKVCLSVVWVREEQDLKGLSQGSWVNNSCHLCEVKEKRGTDQREQSIPGSAEKWVHTCQRADTEMPGCPDERRMGIGWLLFQGFWCECSTDTKRGCREGSENMEKKDTREMEVMETQLAGRNRTQD